LLGEQRAGQATASKIEAGDVLVKAKKFRPSYPYHLQLLIFV
jgi:hypothetical protein